MNPSTFRSKLKTQLAARSDYTTLGVDVFAYPPGKLASTKPTCFVDAIENVTQTGLALDGNTQAEYSVTVGGYAPGVGSKDSEWQTMEANAYTIVNGLIQQLLTDSTVNGACDFARVTSWNLVPSQMPENNRAFMDFEATITVRVFP